MGRLSRRSCAVGYKQPPAHTRFVKGKSGNPKGRPRGTGKANGLARLVSQPVTVTLEGKQQQVPLSEALILAMAQRALSGNVVATREVLKILEKIGAEQKAAEEAPPTNVRFMLCGPDMQDCNLALARLGIVEGYLDSWRICTWAVEAALARNPQLLADEKDRELISGNMLNPLALE